MEGEGLASRMTYGSGEGNTIKHFYAGAPKGKTKEAKSKMNKKKKD